MAREFYGGRDFEMDFFGKKVHWPTIMKEKGLGRDEYLPYKKAMKFVIDNYPIDAFPYTKMSKDIYDSVAEELGFDLDSPEEEAFEDLKNRLKFFDATQTTIDQFHNVDGFFVYRDKDGNERICTLDTTLNPGKGEEDVKSDVWIGDAPDHQVDKVGYEKWYQSRSRVIAAYLKGESTSY